MLENLTRLSVLALLLALWPPVFHPCKCPSSSVPFADVDVLHHFALRPLLISFRILSLDFCMWFHGSPLPGRNLYSKSELLPKSHIIKFNCLLRSSPGMFHRYLKFNISKNPTKSALLSLSTMLLSEKLQCNELSNV